MKDSSIGGGEQISRTRPGRRCHPTPSHPANQQGGEEGRSNDLAGGARGGVGGVSKQIETRYKRQ